MEFNRNDAEISLAWFHSILAENKRPLLLKDYKLAVKLFEFLELPVPSLILDKLDELEKKF